MVGSPLTMGLQSVLGLSAATDIAPSGAGRQVSGSRPSARDYLPDAKTAFEKL
jgi:hypothetical protein